MFRALAISLALSACTTVNVNLDGNDTDAADTTTPADTTPADTTDTPADTTDTPDATDTTDTTDTPPDPTAVDTDGDGLSDDDERALGLAPGLADTDADGVPDGEEVANGWDGADQDTDDDGAEQAAGSDPLLPDTDADGLTDGAEAAAGTSPTLADTDGDGVADATELTNGTDPVDALSYFVYACGWPVAPDPDKDALEAADFAANRSINGRRFRRFSFTDTCGEAFDLYDFALGGRSTILIITPEWQQDARNLSAWLAGSTNRDYYQAYNSMYGRDLPAAVANGEVGVIQVLVVDDAGYTATPQDISDWQFFWSIPGAPLLTDPLGTLNDYTQLTFWPWLVLLDDQMVVVDQGQPEAAIRALTAP